MKSIHLLEFKINHLGTTDPIVSTEVNVFAVERLWLILEVILHSFLHFMSEWKRNGLFSGKKVWKVSDRQIWTVRACPTTFQRNSFKVVLAS
ncbi:hypothetical protein TNCV_3273301 [Trichonephila clavipes]|nr:hypothetical protein TNCV_3273301 [Trichonephila clavipes]